MAEAPKEIVTAEQVLHDLRANNGSEQTVAMINAGVPRLTVFGEILICAHLPNFEEDRVRAKVDALLAQYYPQFDRSKFSVVNEEMFGK
ncbi:hypothetical protein HYZ99_04540 [Candidatus Peregrinibacteria bacterium]|nr:hypothetical protein [Candidatus Peregrinibacteria bacterium]